MIKSNISIASNIYVRNSSDIRRDRKYTEKITELNCLMIYVADMLDLKRFH